MTLTLAAFTWLPLDTWIVAVGALAGAACALPGTFLVLRKMSMMGDAISHAVLPGLAIAFLVTGSRSSVSMLIGAALAGVLAAALTQWLHSQGKVEEGASMGVVFTLLFAVGLILIVRAADHVDLDANCVLYGAIEQIPLDVVRVGGREIPRAVFMLSGVLLLNALFVIVCYKELKISTFDPGLATTLGINAQLMHYLLMTLVAVTTVAAFESVGSILVIAMLIVPPATAHLLTDRLSVMLLLSVVLAALAAALGHVGAIVLPGWIGFAGISTNTAGMIAVAAGALFLLAILAAPRYGVISKTLHRLSLALRVVREDVLGLLYRLEELGRRERGQAATIRAAIGVGPLACWLALRGLRRAGNLRRVGTAYQLTERGRAAAGSIIRSHRLWETYLTQHVVVPPDHIHESAELLEHVTDAEMRTRLAESTHHPTHDPHQAPIPPAEDDRA